MKAIAVYDDKCRVCTAFSSFGRNILPLGYSTESARQLMRAQFGRDYGFVLMLFTRNKVYWGSEAAAMIAASGYSLSRLSGVVHRIYPLIVAVLNVLLRRKTLPHPPRLGKKSLLPDGNMRLTPAAKKRFDDLMASWQAQTI
ncbi:hypothetical protein HYU12_04445 [Candidatus Woesearchaeota archaeon]|nr:hypothetical protein [Candidatus Woesearchaeota archaeon]